MTSRERLVAAARGGEVDRPPVLSLGIDREGADAVVVTPNEVENTLEREPGTAVLAEVLSPFGRALEFRIPLSSMLRERPEEGQQELERLFQVARADIETAILSGADGIFYRLVGAHPENSTPMEYGGFYLERDRELLESVVDARCNVLYIQGGEDAYLDFVSDLPAHIFAAPGNALEVIRAVRHGAVAAPWGGEVVMRE
jgi:hypothetical protein